MARGRWHPQGELDEALEKLAASLADRFTDMPALADQGERQFFGRYEGTAAGYLATMSG